MVCWELIFVKYGQSSVSYFIVRVMMHEVVIGMFFLQARLLGDAGQMEACSSSIASSTASSQSSSSSKCLSKFSSPFRRKPKGLRKSKEESFEKFLLSTSEDEQATATAATAPNAGSSASAISRDELLRLFILKLDEEANYFQVSASPEEELCDCQKCQVTL